MRADGAVLMQCARPAWLRCSVPYTSTAPGADGASAGSASPDASEEEERGQNRREDVVDHPSLEVRLPVHRHPARGRPALARGDEATTTETPSH